MGIEMIGNCSNYVFDRILRPKGSKMYEFLGLLGVLVLWLALQMWILPRFGVST
jgi:hypothetical protein